MRTLFATAGLLALLTGVALADDENTEQSESVTEETEQPAQDCSTLEGEAKTACEEAQKAESTEPTEETKTKGKGGLKKSENNDMKGYEEDD